VAAPGALKGPKIADVRRVKAGLIHFVNFLLHFLWVSVVYTFALTPTNKTCLAQEMVVFVVSVPAGYVALQL
jgi:hypothetical protein